MARHGIFEVLVSDNGPQFNNSEMHRFSAAFGFIHISASPRYARANGVAVSAVKRLKAFVKKSKDPYLALLAYRTIPLANEYSPAELSMGRRLRTTLPVAPHTLKLQKQPMIIDTETT